MSRGPRTSPLLALALVSAAAWQGSPRVPADLLPQELAAVPPLGLPEALPEPPDNPSSRERVALGRRLFFDPLLSLDRTVACATCHRPEHGFADREATSTGVLGRRTERNAPTLFNRGFAPRQMWDGRVATLEEQALLPIENELEMALPLDEALSRLSADPGYVDAFAAAFGEPPTRAGLAKALAAFVRRLTFGDSPVDRFRGGDLAGMSSLERTGMWLFESRGGCWRCHAGPNFSDEDFHNTGVGAAEGRALPGREAVTGDPRDRGKFKTPTLRALALTAPYMHDGSLATLEEVVDFYARGGNANADLDPRLTPVELDPSERAALVAFLRALSRAAPAPPEPEPGEPAEK
jgi:cytochrome c peroxidase